jgi:hypothetical protein
MGVLEGSAAANIKREGGAALQRRIENALFLGRMPPGNSAFLADQLHPSG